MRVLTVFGTRPEAIKLAPVIRRLEATPGVVHAACVTGQHREMINPVLSFFGIIPAFDLQVMTPGQDPGTVASAALADVSEAIDAFRPDWVVVQGDTSSALAGALAGFYRKCRIAHVEAGLRTGRLDAPWPEEGNRRLIAPLAALHFPPTLRAAANLRREGVSRARLHVTGNTVIDALQFAARRLQADSALRADLASRFAYLDSAKRLVLMTGHRRENFNGGLERVCRAVAQVVRERPDVEFVFPVHLNPQVRRAAHEALCGCARVHLIEPQPYLPFVHLMQRAHVIITDSGGIQEEAPALGKPVLVTRETTERPEAVEAGAARLVGTSTEALVSALNDLLDNPQAYRAMAQARLPFGDGQAARRIVERLLACG